MRDLRTPRQGRARPGAGRAHERGDRTSRPRSRCRRGRSGAACSATGGSRSSTSQTGDQPVESERGDVVAVFNGELYNFRELRRELEAAGHEIRGTGDTPLIPHAYEEWGLDFPKRLEGMFAIALWDRARERLVLVRDRLGKKPLLYAQLPDGTLAFASETKALLTLPELCRASSTSQQLDAFLALQYVAALGPARGREGAARLVRGRRERRAFASSATGRPRPRAPPAGRASRGSSACATR